MALFLDRRKFLQVSSAATIGRWSSIAAAADPFLAMTTEGPVRGFLSKQARCFTGVPYGQASRFAAPRCTPRRQGVFDASKPAALAPQLPGLLSFEGTIAEECLQLNVWAPVEGRDRPVLVYIHGGGNETGWSNDPALSGEHFAAAGVVFVTLNYRLGVFGFAELGDILGPRYSGSGNNGLRDIILALRWIRANIRAFGGDADRVTIAGNSAGGKNVCALMSASRAQGLFARAAVFSGGAQTVHNLSASHKLAGLLAARSGGPERLLKQPLDEILEIQAAVRAEWQGNFPFRPVVDGVLLEDVPLVRIREGEVARIPLLIGSNVDESRIMVPSAIAAGPLRQKELANERLDLMEALDTAYAGAFPALLRAERRWKLITAEEYGMPCLRVAEAHAKRGAEVWRYRFQCAAPAGPFKGYTPHSMELPFWFARTDANGPTERVFGLTADETPLAGAMQAALISFVSTGQPKAAGMPEWLRFENGRRQTMLLDRQPVLVEDPDRLERSLWNDQEQFTGL